MIIKTRKKDCPYVQIENSLLEITDLSWRAKGILVYLLSKPSDWWIRSEDVIAKATEGRDAVRAAMKELQDAGYAQLINTAAGREWLIFDSPQEPRPENPSLGPSPENPSVASSVKPQPEKRPLVIRKGSNKENEGDGEFKLDPSPSKQPKVGTVTSRKPTQDQIETFCETIQLPRSDGEIMLLKWNADGWPKNWMDKIHYWRRMGYMPSQKPGAQQPTPAKSANSQPERWEEFITTHPNPAYKEFLKWSSVRPSTKTWLPAEHSKWLKTGRHV